MEKERDVGHDETAGFDTIAENGEENRDGERQRKQGPDGFGVRPGLREAAKQAWLVMQGEERDGSSGDDGERDDPDHENPGDGDQAAEIENLRNPAGSEVGK